MRSLYDARYRRLLERLRAARRAAGLSQHDVAAAVGRPQSFVSKCEGGERRVDAVELLEFAQLYGRSVGYFVAEGEGAGGASLSTEASTARQRPGRSAAKAGRNQR